jgi:hypothetical protein
MTCIIVKSRNAARIARLLAVGTLLLGSCTSAAQAKDDPAADFARISGVYASIAELSEVKTCLRRSPDEIELLRDASDGHFDEHPLYGAAMIASGVSADDRLDCHARMIHLRREQANRLDNAADAENARIVFEFLHRHVLTGGYREDASNVAATLRGGPYNCLSAAILFIDLAREAGFDAQAVQAPGHVYCQVRAPADAPREDWQNIELTAPDHFQRSRATHGPQRDDTHRVLSAVELVGLVYFNRGIEALARRQFAAAAAANLTALTLDPASRTAADNLLATMNNWALALAREGNPAEALRIVKTARQIAPDHAHLWTNERYLQSRVGGGDR